MRTSKSPVLTVVAAGRGDVQAPFRQLPTEEEYDKYWREKAMPQVAELIKDYGVKLFWFDCWQRRPCCRRANDGKTDARHACHGART